MLLHSKLLSQLPGIRHEFSDPRTEPPAALVRCQQVHGDQLFRVSDESSEQMAPVKADGLFTNARRLLGVQTADCLPLLFASQSGEWIAAVHAGWRGLHKGILLRALEHLAAGTPLEKLVVAIGPAIGPCCFEVSPEVVEQFQSGWGPLWPAKNLAPWQTGRPAAKSPSRSQAPASANNLWLDLGQIARLQLAWAGIPEVQIESVGGCTYCGAGKLASYRRGTHEGVAVGRQWSWISREPAT